MNILTILAAHHQVLEETDGDAFFRRQNRPNVDRQKLEHFALAPEFGREGSSGYALLAVVDPLVFHESN